MDCKDARLLLEFARPGDKELDHDEAEALKQHLADCPDCATLAQAEQRADEHIGRAMRDVPVPDGLRERVLQKLAAERVPWYRRWPVRIAGAAALLLVVGGLGLIWWLGEPPAVDVPSIHARMNALPRTREAVDEAFRALNVTTMAPPNFNYGLLDSYGLAVFQDQQVPHLLFVSESNLGSLAHVYILSSQQFDLEATRKSGPAPLSGGRQVILLDHPDNKADYLYLVVYRGMGRDLGPISRRSEGL
jgi:anti-sigma factor (TIGR02949 family)